MSPYAEHPKSNRISVEWGRETIEMQENGSTKNLLQMTDIYYSVCILLFSTTFLLWGHAYPPSSTALRNDTLFNMIC